MSIDRDELLELITKEDVIEIMKNLGCDEYKNDENGEGYIFQSICHGSTSYKLYYYFDSGIFKCYSCCGVMSLYDLIMTVEGLTFRESYEYLCKFKNISLNRKRKVGLQKKIDINTDLDFLKIHLYKRKAKSAIKLPSYDTQILNIFDNYMPQSWSEEGISSEIAYYFGIRMYFSQRKAIIPHYDIHGSLVGIRARSFNEWDVENGRKYMPVTIQNLTYRYPTNLNLFGIYQNQNNIKSFKKVIIFESEKSVLLFGSYYGQENNTSLALGGMTFSLYQRDLLLSLGVEEVVVALDKQYQVELMEDKNNIKEYKEYEAYIKRIIKISAMFINYSKVSVMCCWDTTISYKESPIDRGKEAFEKMYKERFLISDVEELKEMIE